MKTFKPGDRIKCVKVSPYPGMPPTLGGEYVVINGSINGKDWIQCKPYTASQTFYVNWLCEDFELVDTYKINQYYTAKIEWGHFKRGDRYQVVARRGEMVWFDIPGIKQVPFYQDTATVHEIFDPAEEPQDIWNLNSADAVKSVVLEYAKALGIKVG